MNGGEKRGMQLRPSGGGRRCSAAAAAAAAMPQQAHRGRPGPAPGVTETTVGAFSSALIF